MTYIGTLLCIYCWCSDELPESWDFAASRPECPTCKELVS